MYAVQRWGFGTVHGPAPPCDSVFAGIAAQVARVPTELGAAKLAAKTFGIPLGQLLKSKPPEPAVMSAPQPGQVLMLTQVARPCSNIVGVSFDSSRKLWVVQKIANRVTVYVRHSDSLRSTPITH